jgi:hypothetical protein
MGGGRPRERKYPIPKHLGLKFALDSPQLALTSGR